MMLIKKACEFQRTRIVLAFSVISIIGICECSRLWGLIGPHVADKTIPHAIIYVGGIIFVGAVAIGAMLAAAFSGHKWKWLFFILFALSLLFDSVYLGISGHAMRYTNWVVLWQARENMGDALSFYCSIILDQIPSLIPLAIGFLIAPRLKSYMWVWALALIVLSTASYVGICITRSGGGTEQFPPSTSLYGMLTATAFDNTTPGYNYKTKLKPTAQPIAANIVVVIDESVRDDIFNHVVIPQVHLGTSNWHMYNFGTATSMANCSAQSNIMIRKTVRPGHVKHDLYHHALIWGLAHNAGFKTWLLDAQHHGIGHDYFNAKERAMINHIPDVPSGNDVKLVPWLVRIWKIGSSFSLVIKSGSHFPYIGKYPKSYHSQSKALQAAYVQEKPMRQHYVNAVDYQTGQFFYALLLTRPSKRTVIVYMSDHGQNLEDGLGGTHCNSSPESLHSGAGMVPLVVIANFSMPKLKLALPKNRNALSAYDMVATVRHWLGYSGTSETELGLTRHKTPPIHHVLYGPPFSHFGSKLHWMTVRTKDYKRMEMRRWDQHFE